MDTIGSDFKPNVDKKKYKDSVMECFEKINSYFLKEKIRKVLSQGLKTANSASTERAFR